jgi:hypothetical protein
MASVIIPISKKSAQEELIETLVTLDASIKSSYVENGTITDKGKFLDEVIAWLPIILNSQAQEIFERSTLIGYIFNDFEEFPKFFNALESFPDSLKALYSLSFLYGVVNSGYNKFRIFRAIYKQASKDPSNLTLIQPHLLKIEDFMKSWTGVPLTELTEMVRDLLHFSVPENTKSRLILRLLHESQLDPNTIDNLIGKYLSTTTDYELEKLTELESYKKCSQAVSKLIELLINSTATEVIKYLEQHEAELTAKGYQKEKVLEISRVTGLVKLTNNTNQVTFEQVAERLSVSQDDVDFWVVQAVSNGMIKGKIDAIHKVIYIEQNKLVADKKTALDLLNRFEKSLS